MKLALKVWILCTALFAHLLHAASLGIWPIDPRIDAPAAATLVWIKNNNKTDSVVLQARIFYWRQENNEDKLDPQDELVVSPPLIEVKPGAQQIFHIMNRQGAVQSIAQENSYRLLIDEVPKESATKGSLLRFQMRYSLPLFVGVPDGYAVKSSEPGLNKLQQDLHYKIVYEPSSFLEIKNNGPLHARLSHVVITNSETKEKSYYLSQGLLGYVLPYSTRRWPLADEQLDALMKKMPGLPFSRIIRS